MLKYLILPAVVTAVALPVTAQEPPRSWTIYADTLASSNRTERDIDALSLTLSTPLRQTGPFTLGVQGGLLSATGRSSENGGITYVDASALAVFGGGFARFSPANPSATIQPFMEVGIAAMITDRSFPDDPSLTMFDARLYGKFDARLGMNVTVSETLTVQAAFALNHISNGSGLGPENINFDGAGFSLGLVQSW